ncbi:MAG: PorV/PorQ family protein [Candidatus Marinimicrobia bacterium]|nr:PorV/PorQ family protein [Candidatus Neomarinimicrobiota bacterium]
MKHYTEIFISLLLFSALVFGQDRVGTTSGNFLELGYGTAGISMGDAHVSNVRDISSVYWNPAGLAYMTNSQAQFMYMPWIAEMNTFFGAVGVSIPRIGNLALSILSMDFGEMEVTNLDFQEGTGETFSAMDMAFVVTYSRKLAQWFSFGTSAKYISSSIWHTKASAIAADLGVIINTQFFSPTGNREDGLNIGMSISNYGTRMQYDGMDLLRSIDIKEDEAGNYANVQGQFTLKEWELPLIYRFGISLAPVVTKYQRLLFAIDALHPNNNSESVNLGAEYCLRAGSFGKLYLRSGYKGLFMTQSQFGVTAGFGIELFMIGKRGMSVDYSFQDVGVLGTTQSYSIKVSF